MRETDFIEAVENAGGTLYIVGGWVRDMLRGEKPQDKDFVVAGMERETFLRLFPAAVCTGKSFPVYLLEIDGVKAEVAFARREKKTGRGYTGFSVDFAASVTIEEDLLRRDTTMNSMALRLPEKTLIDPYGGQADIERRTIRATSKHFLEDPVRALRAARQAAELDFSVADDTVPLMAACGSELMSEPADRLVHELSRALAAPRPSLFFQVLLQADLLQLVFPELFAMRGKMQPAAYHPEGDAFAHAMQVVDETARRTRNLPARFAALAHDLGKGTTPAEMLPHHYGHEGRGLEALAAWNKRMTLPRAWLQAARFVIKEHMRAPLLAKKGKMVELLLAVELSGLSFADFCSIILVDHGALPRYLAEGEEILALLRGIRGGDAPPGMEGPAVGRWLHEQRVRALGRYLAQGTAEREVQQDSAEE
ncbi:HD domain-containing protein [Selenomonas sputigena]|uniref:HD domain-containing protein n=1 Tax=Selenomonas sputigena TaxID=69823 RepID=A0ABV3X7W1_9FIRM